MINKNNNDNNDTLTLQCVTVIVYQLPQNYFLPMQIFISMMKNFPPLQHNTTVKKISDNHTVEYINKSICNPVRSVCKSTVSKCSCK